MKHLTRTQFSVLGLALVALWTTVACVGCYRPLSTAGGTSPNQSGDSLSSELVKGELASPTSAWTNNTAPANTTSSWANTPSLPNTTYPATIEPESTDPGWANTLPDLSLSDDDDSGLPDLSLSEDDDDDTGLPELSLSEDDGDSGLPDLSMEPETDPRPEPETVQESDPEPEPEAVALAPSYPEGMELAPLPLVLPAPAFRGTPVPLTEPNVAKPRGKPREPFPAPVGTVNLALGKAVSSSDPSPTSGELDLVTDGDKEATDFGCLELHPGSEWVQVDLGKTATIWAVVVWHNHAQARVYRDVVIQVSDDPDFLDEFTVFNNDYDNSSGLGTANDRGELDKGYVETSEGGLIDCAGAEGRYVRLYSRGNTIDGENHYTEVEVYGIPKK